MTSVSAATRADLYHLAELPDQESTSGRLQLVATFKVACPDLARNIVDEVLRASMDRGWHERLGATAVLQQGPFRPSRDGDMVVLRGPGPAESFVLDPGGCTPVPLATVEELIAPARFYVVEKVSGFGDAHHVASCYVTAVDGTIQVYENLSDAARAAERLDHGADGSCFHRALPQPEW